MRGSSVRAPLNIRLPKGRLGTHSFLNDPPFLRDYGKQKARCEKHNGLFWGVTPLGLALGELEALACTRLTGLFALFHSGITAQETLRLEHRT
jgi:hypothetical protein